MARETTSPAVTAPRSRPSRRTGGEARGGASVRQHWRLTSFALVFGALAVASPLRSQELETTDAQLWLDYGFHGKPKERLRTSLDVGYRQVVSESQLIGEWLRVHLRAGFAWEAKAWLSLEGGLGGFYTYERDEDIEDTLELRPWQGARVSWPTFNRGRRIALTHLARLEERIVSRAGEIALDVRFRYRLSTSIPLNKPTVQTRALYVPLSIEGFVSPSGNIEETFANRLRITAGLGWVASPNWTFRLAYIAQKSRSTVGVGFETSDHIVRFSVITTVRLKDLIWTH